MVDAVAHRDVSRVLDLTDPDVECVRSRQASLEEGVYRGHDGIRQYVRDLDDARKRLKRAYGSNVTPLRVETGSQEGSNRP